MVSIHSGVLVDQMATWSPLRMPMAYMPRATSLVRRSNSFQLQHTPNSGATMQSLSGSRSAFLRSNPGRVCSCRSSVVQKPCVFLLLRFWRSNKKAFVLPMKTKALLPRYHFFWNGIPFPLWAVTGRPSGATERFRTGRSRERSRFAPDAFPPSGVSLGVRVGRPCRSSRLQNIISKLCRFVKRKFCGQPGAWDEDHRSRNTRPLRAGCQSAHGRREPAPRPERYAGPGHARSHPACLRPG